MIVAVTGTTVQAVLGSVLAIVGTLSTVYAIRQSILSGRRQESAEKAANTLRERTVDREDFESVVDGLRGVLAERTAQYNDTVTEIRTLRHVLADRVQRCAQLEAENRDLNRRLEQGGHPQ